MSNYEMVISAITSVGFPIVMCGFFAYFIMTTLKKLEETVQSNTTVISKLVSILEGDTNGKNI